MSTDEGWTRVHRKSRRHRPSSAKSIASTQPHSSPDTFAPRTSGVLRPPEALRADYDKLRAEWLASPACAALLRLLDAQPPRVVVPVRRAVCLGIGTFDPADGAWEAKRAAYVQLCAFSTIVSQLEKYTQLSVECVFQDPIFTPSDISFLTALGHRVVPSPAAYALVEGTTLLFAVHLYRPIYAAAFQQPDLPAMFVGTGWDVWDTVTMEEATDLENMKRMDRTYTRHEFPQDAASTAFSSTSIYFAPQGAKPSAARPPSSEQGRGAVVEEASGDASRQGGKALVSADEKADKPVEKDITDKTITDKNTSSKEEPIDEDIINKDTGSKEEPTDKDIINEGTGSKQKVEKRSIGRV
ncbi:Sensitivity To Red Light Reduced-like, SRR1 [Cordyceps fumosorosea ARSEF 2679]|uniref:Sensitivity To Red Light Reduced-like, SRR1 n=1 Tax=Cordyceps fumosorosea (strain ARSEF 2679) TaxID=1081104 RepID=A0A167N402_CORFA|nr:Sensitivity To Red Light Reduced-like, SRR1 [Cordyceps fumosorosea ARSEF 2679]OAA55104.1 Sensitivity To Red Light Reduced-like, SRR1 [Cordyceps fumosorosea ARSEF 2679]